MNPTITVAIATLGRVEEVIETLKGLLKGNVVPLEILVSDQNTPPLNALDSGIQALGGPIRHLRCAPKGVVFNMNSLLTQANGDIILFIDDDVIVPPDFLAAHLKCYESEQVSAVAGRVEQPSGDLPPETIRYTGQYSHLTGKMTFDYNGLRAQSCFFGIGCNMSFYRQKLIDAGGFDEGFAGNGYFFETEAGFRFVKKFPGSMIFSPQAELKHLAAPRGGARITDKGTHLYYFMRNGMRFYRRHGTWTAIVYQVIKSLIVIPLKALYHGDPRIARMGFRGLRDGLRQNMLQEGKL